MEYEVNQILITPLGGDLSKPLYMYQASLYASFLVIARGVLTPHLVMCPETPRYHYNFTSALTSQSEVQMVWRMILETMFS